MTRAKRLRAFCLLFFFLNVEALCAQTVAELKTMPNAFEVRPSGLGVRVQNRGFGPYAKPGDMVKYQVECVDNDGNVLFSTADRRAPQQFQYNPKNLTPAIAEGLGLCRNGSRLILRSPSRLNPARINGPHTDTLYYYISIVSLNGKRITPEERAFSELQVRLYPNPAFETAYIAVQGGEAASLRVTIADDTGFPMVSRLLETGVQELDIGDWAPGVYYVEFTARGLTMRHKLVKTGVE